MKLKLEHLGNVEIKELTVGDILEVANLGEKGFPILASRALVNPKKTPEEIAAMPMKYLEDISEIVTKASE